MQPTAGLFLGDRAKIVERTKVHYAIEGMFAALLLIYFICFYWLFWPYIPITILNEPVPVTGNNGKTSVYGPGDYVYLEIKYNKVTSMNGIISRQLMGRDVIYGLPSYIANIEPGQGKTIKVGVRLPYKICSGSYYILTTIVYEVNPLRTVAVNYRSDCFDVIAK